MSTISQGSLDPIPVGTYCRVSDGTPRPPERFHKKLKEWQWTNYDAIVTSYKHDRQGFACVQKVSTIGHWCIRIFVTVELARLTPVPGKPRFVVNVDAFNPEVVGVVEGSPVEIMPVESDEACAEAV
jgi:hypothetical protein